MSVKTLAQAITDGLDEVLKKDEKTLIFGEDIGLNGGVFRVTDGLQEKHGNDRVFDTPLAESAILGICVGLVTEGYRPIPEIQFSGFILEAMDALVAQISRVRYRYGNTRNAPITIRAPYGGGVHTPELHSDSLEGIMAQVPGLRVVVPTTAYDAKGLLISSVESNDPVIFLEHLRLYRTVKDEVPDGYYTVPLDKAAVRREGTDVTIVSYGLMATLAEKAAKKLEQEGIRAEVIDLRTVAPFDMETITASIKKTHRVLVVQEAQRIAGIAGQLISEINERSFMDLDAPAMRVTGPDTVFPFGAAESIWLPDEKDIIEKVKELVSY
ncbi:TPA: alpha-ketoacid dehydrogenase subunit beta [Staphylococcus delphini]|nr:alpha-ketoacid dehydrogenase subunit beta [Staphylococcus delphini]HEC2200892.1 alpha-ketoacid dehydrogenase subunit beta [Staphylococcus delphini]HEC2215523.1 alpha-ketoacid dehydrogenase subunit beta [Staphylococcus delphini]HEC2217913.1 alpha-ketoacid dehydrogenase subunit beta [Staphylococcus delphini]HEC2246906.1 alpha-ketoacid dehydrogenase subunit beta [Staphylococcus delphini]